MAPCKQSSPTRTNILHHTNIYLTVQGMLIVLHTILLHDHLVTTCEPCNEELMNVITSCRIMIAVLEYYNVHCTEALAMLYSQ